MRDSGTSKAPYYLRAIVYSVSQTINKVQLATDEIVGVSTEAGSGGQIIQIKTPIYESEETIMKNSIHKVGGEG